MTLPLFDADTQVERLLGQIRWARTVGLRPATPDEAGRLDPAEVFTSSKGGPPYVRIQDHGQISAAALDAMIGRYRSRDEAHAAEGGQ